MKAKIKIMKSYSITGTYHGSIIFASSEGEARRIFHRAWGGESIIFVKVRNLWEWY